MERPLTLNRVYHHQRHQRQLNGILWGGSGDGKTFVFSPLTNVKGELGALPPTSNYEGAGADRESAPAPLRFEYALDHSEAHGTLAYTISSPRFC